MTFYAPPLNSVCAQMCHSAGAPCRALNLLSTQVGLPRMCKDWGWYASHRLGMSANSRQIPGTCADVTPGPEGRAEPLAHLCICQNNKCIGGGGGGKGQNKRTEVPL